jgi:hypothetical protein
MEVIMPEHKQRKSELLRKKGSIFKANSNSNNLQA